MILYIERKSDIVAKEFESFRVQQVLDSPLRAREEIVDAKDVAAIS